MSYSTITCLPWETCFTRLSGKTSKNNSVRPPSVSTSVTCSAVHLGGSCMLSIMKGTSPHYITMSTSKLVLTRSIFE